MSLTPILLSQQKTTVAHLNEEANSNKKVLKIGIDFGGVLSIHDRIHESHNKNDKINADDKVGQHRSTAVNMPHALEALKILKNAKIETIDAVEYHLVSFAGKTRAAETKLSLQASTDLFSQLYFTKSKQNKKFVCQYLGCDIMIDDTLDILVDIAKSYKNVQNAPYLILFTGDPGFDQHNREDLTKFKSVAELKQDEGIKGQIFIANSWLSIIKFVKNIVGNTILNQPDNTIQISKFIYP